MKKSPEPEPASHHAGKRTSFMKELTILMPCLNEAETLGACIGRAKKLLSDLIRFSKKNMTAR